VTQLRRATVIAFLLLDTAAIAPAVVTAQPEQTTEEKDRSDKARTSSSAVTSEASLARIRAALRAEESLPMSGTTEIGFADDRWIVAPRPTFKLAPNVGFTGGVNLYDDPTHGSGPVPMGGPTHQSMLDHMIPREVDQMVSTDVLGIATASAFALIPQAIKGLAGLFSRDKAPPRGPRFLTPTQRARALENIRAELPVHQADLEQRGRTVTLDLLVDATLPPTTARVLGEQFLHGVKHLAVGEVPPEKSDLPGPGNFDYVVRVRSDAGLLAHGGKSTGDSRIRW